VKVGALAFILLVPTTYAINLQLLSNIWILQTLPAVFLGLYTNWFHRRALLVGLLGGLISGTWMVIDLGFQSAVYPLSFGGVTIPIHAAISALAVNLLLSLSLTPVFRLVGVSTGRDSTTWADFEAHPLPGSSEALLLAQMSQNTQLPVPTQEQVMNQVR
jgi:solute:Na+ symporter, SSS family